MRASSPMASTGGGSARSLPALMDSRGKAYGKALLAGATAEGAWVDYSRVNPQSGKDEPKSSWVVLHDGYIFGCGVYVGQ